MEHIATPKVENVHLLDNINTRNSRVSENLHPHSKFFTKHLFRWAVSTLQQHTWSLSLLRRKRSSGSCTCTSAPWRSCHSLLVAALWGSSAAISGPPPSWWPGTEMLRTSSRPWSTCPGLWPCRISTASNTEAKATFPNILAGHFSIWGPSFKDRGCQTGNGRSAVWTTTTRSAQLTQACLSPPPRHRQLWSKAPRGLDQRVGCRLLLIIMAPLEPLCWGAVNLCQGLKVGFFYLSSLISLLYIQAY